MQAVIKSGSSQYLVSPGMEILVDKLGRTENGLTFSDVLLVADGENILVGTPYLPGYSVRAEILAETKGDKIRVLKYKAKSRYRRHTGFRAKLSKIKILSINPPGTSSTSETEKPPVKKVGKKIAKTKTKVKLV